jgi:cytochrome c peroxidase
VTRFPVLILTVSVLALSAPARAQAPADFLAGFERQARQTDPGFQGFSAERGRQFFTRTHGGDWSCASCHTDAPATTGKHAKTGKSIQPLAPAANPERFTSAAKVEKWFKRNCNDVLGRACTAQEKGDVLAWLMHVVK